MFNPIFCWWVELCSLPVIYLGPNYGGGNVENGDLLQKVPCMHCYLSAPSPAAGHRQSMPPLETPGHSWAGLGQSLVGHCSFLLGPGAYEVLFVSSKSLIPSPVSVLAVGLMATSSKRAYAIPKSAAPRAPAPAAGHCWPVLHSRHSNTFLSQSLWGLWVHSWLISVKKENMLYKEHPATFGNLFAFLKVLVVYPTCVAM